MKGYYTAPPACFFMRCITSSLNINLPYNRSLNPPYLQEKHWYTACLSLQFFSEKIDSSSGKEFSAFEPLLNNVNEIYPDLMCEYCCPFCYLGLKMSPFITNEGGPWSDIISHRVVSSMISWLCPFNPPLSHPESSNEGCIPFRTTLRTVPTN